MRIKLPSRPSSLFTAAALVAACSVINAPDDVVTEAAGGSPSGKGGATSGKGGDTNGGQPTGTAGEGASPANGGAAGEPGTAGGGAGEPGTAGAAGAPGPGCVTDVLYQADFTAGAPVQVGGSFNTTGSSAFDLSDDNLSCSGNFVTCDGSSQQDRAANSGNRAVLRFVFTIGQLDNTFTVNFNASSDNGIELSLNATEMALYANNDQIGADESFNGSHDPTAVNYAELIYENAEVTATVASSNYASEGGVVAATVSGDLLPADFPVFSNIDVQAFHEDNTSPLYVDDLLLTEEVCD